MKKASLTLVIVLAITRLLYSQEVKDSLVLFSDLKFHSTFEKEAIYNFAHEKTDTFDLFLAIDETMTRKEADELYLSYLSIFSELSAKKIDSKKGNARIKLAYSTVHNRLLKRYNSNEYFPVMFRTGTYNCVSASMLYALIYGQLKIPTKVMISQDHVYLVANPGENSVVIETTNPSFEKALLTGEFKQQFVDNARRSKLISDEEYKNQSVEEMFEHLFNAVKDGSFNNLPGIQYYNKALAKMQNNENKEALELCQKAYFFYPDQQVKGLLQTALLFHIEKCNFEKVSDIDYLAQLSKFESTEPAMIIGVFNNILHHFLQYNDKEQYCDSLFHRLSARVSDKKMLEELKFAYYIQMSYRFQNTSKVEYYVTNALKIKGNHLDANNMMEAFLFKKLNEIIDPQTMLDSITAMEGRNHLEQVSILLKEYRLIAYLKNASDYFLDNKATEGEMYLGKFEQACNLPVENKQLNYYIKNTYYRIANYYHYKNNRVKSKSYVERGFKYLPGDELLKSVISTY